MSLVQEGAVNRWDELVQRALTVIVPVVSGRVPANDREDVVQNALIRFYKSLRDYDPGRSSLRVWVRRIAVWEVQDYYRKLGPLRGLRAMLDCHEPAVDPPEPPRELMEQICAIVGEANCRMIQMVVLEGYRYAEVGEWFGIRGDAVKMRIQRAYRRLREELGDWGYG
ncbi:MAG TPA: RNA polymerase sigma factor [Dehalococcoidia bacterium]|nr:RNA polymerase sigma factor [Dehalococcoidia bacterium]